MCPITNPKTSRLPWAEIWESAEIVGVDAALIAAVIQAESGGNEFAMRYEPGFRWVKDTHEWARRIGCSHDTELIGQSTSWGLMQVMGATARANGFDAWFPKLCDKRINVLIGAKILSDLIQKYKEPKKVISAYNAGVPIDGNAAYVDRVLSCYFEIREDLKRD